MPVVIISAVSQTKPILQPIGPVNENHQDIKEQKDIQLKVL